MDVKYINQTSSHKKHNNKHAHELLEGTFMIGNFKGSAKKAPPQGRFKIKKIKHGT